MTFADKVKEVFSFGRLKTTEAMDYPSGQSWLQHLMMGGLRGQDFLKDIYLDRILTPHEEMYQCEKMSRENAFITSAVEILKNILIGNELTVEAEDDYTKEFYENWIVSSNYKQALGEAIENYIKLGNGYIEILRGLETGMPKKAMAVPRAWKIWVIPDKNIPDKIHFYEEVPKMYKGKDVVRISANYEGYGQKNTIKAVEYKNTLQHFKWGISHIPHYGRSPLASTISDNKILHEIERAMAVVARYKAIPRKVINLLNSDGSAISQKEVNAIIKYWNSLSDLENPVIGGKTVNLMDLSYAGQELNYQPIIDYLKKKITSVLAPQFYIHGDTTTYAVALEQKNLFYLTVMEKRQEIEKPINDLLDSIRIIHNLLPVNKKENGWRPLTKATIKFGEFDFETREEQRMTAINLWNSGAITLDEARKVFDLDELGADNGGGAFKWELTPQQQTQPAMSLSPRGIKYAQPKQNKG